MVRPWSGTTGERLAELVVSCERRGSHVPHARAIRAAWEMRYATRNMTGTGVMTRELLSCLTAQPGLTVQQLRGGGRFDQTRGFVGSIARILSDAGWIHIVLPLQLRRLRPDLLHAAAGIAPLWGRTPLVMTFFDLAYQKYPTHYKRWWVLYMNWLLPRAMRRAAAVIAISEASKKEAIQTFGLDPNRIAVIYLGVDHSRFFPGAGAAADDLLMNLGIHTPYVLAVGTLSTRKNIPLLLEAVAILKARGRWASRQVVLAGAESPGMLGVTQVNDAVARLGLQADVVFAGHVRDKDLPALYARASSLAFPSLYEGFGLPVIEAMACGTPVVAAANSSLFEVVGNAGLLVSGHDSSAFADGLERVLDDQELRAMLRERGLQHAAMFTWERAAEQTLAVYAQVAEHKSLTGSTW